MTNRTTTNELFKNFVCAAATMGIILLGAALYYLVT
jgi:hypothetical protein